MAGGGGAEVLAGFPFLPCLEVGGRMVWVQGVPFVLGEAEFYFREGDFLEFVFFSGVGDISATMALRAAWMAGASVSSSMPT